MAKALPLPWPPLSVYQSQLAQKDLLSLVRNYSEGDGNVEGALLRYLVVRSAGYIEAARDDLAIGHVRAVAPQRIQKRIAVHLNNGQGASSGQIRDFMETFDADWKTELAGVLDADDARLKDQLGALIGARKKIAHGRGETVNVTSAIRWAECADEIVRWMIKRFDPSRTD